MTQWEYGYLHISQNQSPTTHWRLTWTAAENSADSQHEGWLDPAVAVEFVNQLGNEHWEAVAFQGFGPPGSYLFKRPRP